MLAVRVPRERAEEARLLLAEEKILDKHHRIVEEDGDVEIPVLLRPTGNGAGRLESLGAHVIDEREYAWRETFKEPFRDISEALNIPDELKGLLPKKWELLGHVLVLKLDDGLDEYLDHIVRIYAYALGATTVLRDAGGVSGEFREPKMELLLGTDTVTTHFENGVRFRLDASKLMFSSGNVDERIRMATVCEKGENVVDMFAGIGYFTLPMAVHSSPGSITAYEINPLAKKFLDENVFENAVVDIVGTNLSNCLDAEEDVADRVVMGYVGTTHEYLPKAVRILKGRGVIHYHETCPDRLLPSRPENRVRDAVEAEGLACRRLDMRTVKSYAPGVSHVVVDAEVG